MQINIRDTEGIKDLSEDIRRLVCSRQKTDAIFREMAIHESSRIEEQVIEMLASKVEEVKTLRPDLSDTEAYIVAGRLLKQLIACYKSGLDRLLP